MKLQRLLLEWKLGANVLKKEYLQYKIFIPQ